MALDTQQRRFLRGRTHDINPVVMVGDKGLTDNVMIELERALERHELIKVRLRVDRETRKEMIQTISEQCSAEMVHSIGQVACFFRRNPERPVIELPR